MNMVFKTDLAVESDKQKSQTNETSAQSAFSNVN